MAEQLGARAEFTGARGSRRERGVGKSTERFLVSRSAAAAVSLSPSASGISIPCRDSRLDVVLRLSKARLRILAEGSKGFRDERASELARLAGLPLTYITRVLRTRFYIDAVIVRDGCLNKCLYDQSLFFFINRPSPLCFFDWLGYLYIYLCVVASPFLSTVHYFVRGNSTFRRVGSSGINGGVSRLIPRNDGSDVACDSSPAKGSRTPVESP